MEESFENSDLDNLIIKDKKYYKKKTIKILIIIFIILIVIGIIIGLYFVIKEILRKKGGIIICFYRITQDNENIRLINITSNIKYDLIIDDNYYDKNTYHSFDKSGLHNVSFHFQNKLESLEGFFNENDNII